MGGVNESYTRRVSAVCQRRCARSHFFDDRGRNVHALRGRDGSIASDGHMGPLGLGRNWQPAPALLRGQWRWHPPRDSRFGERRTAVARVGHSWPSQPTVGQGVVPATRSSAGRAPNDFGHSPLGNRRTASLPLRWVERHTARRSVPSPVGHLAATPGTTPLRWRRDRCRGAAHFGESQIGPVGASLTSVSDISAVAVTPLRWS